MDTTNTPDPESNHSFAKDGEKHIQNTDSFG